MMHLTSVDFPSPFDRAFIDNVTNRTIEISLGKIYDYAVNYSKYVVLHPAMTG